MELRSSKTTLLNRKFHEEKKSHKTVYSDGRHDVAANYGPKVQKV